jgi:hypothetical protein
MWPELTIHAESYGITWSQRQPPLIPHVIPQIDPANKPHQYPSPLTKSREESRLIRSIFGSQAQAGRVPTFQVRARANARPAPRSAEETRAPIRRRNKRAGLVLPRRRWAGNQLSSFGIGVDRDARSSRLSSRKGTPSPRSKSLRVFRNRSSCGSAFSRAGAESRGRATPA